MLKILDKMDIDKLSSANLPNCNSAIKLEFIEDTEYQQCEVYGYRNITGSLISADFLHTLLVDMWQNYSGNVNFIDFVKQIIRKTNNEELKIEYYKQYLNITPIDMYYIDSKIVISIPEINYEDYFQTDYDEKQIIQAIGRVPGYYSKAVYEQLGIKFPEIEKQCVSYLTTHVDLVESALKKGSILKIEAVPGQANLCTGLSIGCNVIALENKINKSQMYIDSIDFVQGNFVCLDHAEDVHIKFPRGNYCDTVRTILSNIIYLNFAVIGYKEKVNYLSFKQVKPDCFEFRYVGDKWILTISINNCLFEVVKIDIEKQQIVYLYPPILNSKLEEEYKKISEVLFSSIYAVGDKTNLDSDIENAGTILKKEKEEYDKEKSEEKFSSIYSTVSINMVNTTFYSFTLEDIYHSNNLLLDYKYEDDKYYISISEVSTGKKYIVTSLVVQDEVLRAFVLKAYEEDDFLQSYANSNVVFSSKKEIQTIILFLSTIYSEFEPCSKITARLKDIRSTLTIEFPKINNVGVFDVMMSKNKKYGITVSKNGKLYFLFEVNKDRVYFIDENATESYILNIYLYDDPDCALAVSKFISEVFSKSVPNNEFQEKFFSLEGCSSCILEPIKSVTKNKWGIRLSDGKEKHLVVGITDEVETIIINDGTDWVSNLPCTKFVYNSKEEALGAIAMFRAFST